MSTNNKSPLSIQATAISTPSGIPDSYRHYTGEAILDLFKDVSFAGVTFLDHKTPSLVHTKLCQGNCNSFFNGKRKETFPVAVTNAKSGGEDYFFLLVDDATRKEIGRSFQYA